jgi:hypothetical protein
MMKFEKVLRHPQKTTPRNIALLFVVLLSFAGCDDGTEHVDFDDCRAAESRCVQGEVCTGDAMGMYRCVPSSTAIVDGYLASTDSSALDSGMASAIDTAVAVVDASTDAMAEIGDQSIRADAMVTDVGSEPRCDDGLMNGDEIGLDCGGICEPCQPSDPCLSDNGGCGDATYYTCTNNDGAPATCADIDECLSDNGGCGDATYYTCTNHDGASATCADIDECDLGTAQCDVNANCVNTNGGYTCECVEGYGGDGREHCDTVCGDGIVAGQEACDHGGSIQLNCETNQGPCDVCNTLCELEPGVQVPSPKVWDGEAGDGLWESAANWNPNGVPTSSEWAVIGTGAVVSGTRPVCRNVTVEAGSTLRQGDNNSLDARTLGCTLTVHGTYEPSPRGFIPGNKSIELSGAISARVPWAVISGTPFTFWDGAVFQNQNMALRVNTGNTMRFNLSESGFQTIRLGGLLNPQPAVNGFAGWPNISLVVDASKYDIQNGSDLVLIDFTNAEGAFPSYNNLPFDLIEVGGALEGRLNWNANDATLNLILGPSAPPQDVIVNITPQTPNGTDTLAAEVSSEHRTAEYTYEWFVNGERLAFAGNELTEGFSRGETVTVKVYATTTAGASGPFEASVVIENSAPQLVGLSIEPNLPTLGSELTAVFSIIDNDNNDVGTLTECVWQKWTDGWTAMPGGETGNFGSCADNSCSIGDLVRVQCAASDGVDTSNYFASTPVQIFADDCARDEPTCNPDAFGGPPTVDELDYSFWYWPTNHRPTRNGAFQRSMHFLTGHYGLVLNESTGELEHFGVLNDQQSVRQASHRANQDITGLPTGSIRFEAGSGNQNIDVVATEFLSAANDNADIARMIDGGRFMNRVELPSVKYAQASDLTGRVLISAMPRHVSLTHSVKADGASEASTTARIRLSGNAITDYPNVEWLRDSRAVTVSTENGEGWLFVVYEEDGHSTSLTFENGALIAERIANQAVREQSVSLVAAPLTALSTAEIDMYLDPRSTVTIDYRGLNYLADALNFARDVEWDETLGAFRADIITLSQSGLSNTGGYASYTNRTAAHNWYGRHRITVDTHGAANLAVPLAMFSSTGASMNITGGVAMLRDQNGAPLGLPVQTSKNWHDPGNNFYHFYSQPVFTGLEAQTMEFTVASSRWGQTAYAASHAQLSLIGYNSAGGHWDESALGCWGESITYDPDETLRRAMVDDVRPFLVRSVNEWSWTGNVGGADFLRYTTASSSNTIQRLTRVRSTYNDLGPNLTNVVYSGVSADGKIAAHLTSQLGRTDDLVRNYYHLEYTFLQDVRYSRLAFFQMAADRYGDNGYARYAYGNSTTVQSDQAVPNHNRTGYENDAARGIALTGESPWVMLYDNKREDANLPEKYANIGFIVRDFHANIGGTEITTPHINVHRTRNGQSQMAYELGLPHEVGSPWCGAACQGETRMIPAGSTVRATIEYLVIPADKSRYYGASDYLTALPAASYQSTDMALALAAGNQLEIATTVGQLQRIYPVEIQSEAGVLAAEFTMTGGLGYVPVTIKGLSRHDGWRLEQLVDDEWAHVDQAVHGNDYWQTRYDGAVGSYQLTFNLHNRGEERYRLVWLPDTP